MDLLLKFPNSSKREEFLRQLAQERDDILRLCRAGQNLPNAVVTSLSPEQAGWIREHVKAFGRAYEDVQFESLAL